MHICNQSTDISRVGSIGGRWKREAMRQQYCTNAILSYFTPTELDPSLRASKYRFTGSSKSRKLASLKLYIGPDCGILMSVWVCKNCPISGSKVKPSTPEPNVTTKTVVALKLLAVSWRLSNGTKNPTFSGLTRTNSTQKPQEPFQFARMILCHLRGSLPVPYKV